MGSYDLDQAEIARLRAEVERLTKPVGNEAWGQSPASTDHVAYLTSLLDQAERERDEALAQVVVLQEALMGAGVTLIPGFPEARALLDRLQRAEAVVEAVSKYDWGEGYRSIQKALAAHDAGK